METWLIKISLFELLGQVRSESEFITDLGSVLSAAAESEVAFADH